MKKTILFTAIMFTGMLLSFAKATDRQPVPKETVATIRSLLVNADVMIILTSDPRATITKSGDRAFMDQVSVKQNGSVLVIRSTRNRNFKNKGIIYVPAGDLENININSSAYIKSTGILTIPDLRINVNGDCRVHIFTTGKVTPVSLSHEVDHFSRDLFSPGPL